MSYTHADSPLNKPYYNINATTAGPICKGKPCTHLDCSADGGVLDGTCQAICNFPDSVVQRCPLNAANPLDLLGSALHPTAVVNAPGGGGTCSLPTQDKDCCNYLGAGGLFDQVCVAGKSITKGVGGGINLPGCGVLTQVPILGTLPCWGIVLGALGMLGLLLLKRR